LTKKTKNTTTATIEQGQEQPPQDQSETLTAEEQYYRACGEIKRLKQEQIDKLRAIEDHTARIADIQEKHNEAQEAHSQAVAIEEEYRSRLERQQAHAKLGGATAALQAMQTAHELQAKSVASAIAKRALDEAEKLVEEIPAIVASIEQFKADIVQLEHEETVMNDVQSELVNRWGRDEEDAFIADLEAAERRVAEQEEALMQAKASLREVEATAKERLKYWPKRVQYVEKEHLHIQKEEEDKGMSPEEHVFQAQIKFIEALGKWGPQCQARLHSVSIADILALPRHVIAELMHPHSGVWENEYVNGQPVHTNHLIKAAQSHINEARRS